KKEKERKREGGREGRKERKEGRKERERERKGKKREGRKERKKKERGSEGKKERRERKKEEIARKKGGREGRKEKRERKKERKKDLHSWGAPNLTTLRLLGFNSPNSPASILLTNLTPAEIPLTSVARKVQPQGPWHRQKSGETTIRDSVQ
ncbi:Myosin-M heavy chain, partial [Ophiophagus hannah]